MFTTTTRARDYAKKASFTLGAILCMFNISSLNPIAAQESVIAAGESDSEGFQTVWREILSEANIEARYIAVPSERKRRLFVRGKLLLDCCAAPIWRDRPQEIETQLWSETFYITGEHFLFSAGTIHDVSTPEKLTSLRVATVRGFQYQDRGFFGANVAGVDIEDVFRLVAAGRADVGIVSNVDFYLLAPQLPGNFALGPLRLEAPQKVRVHKSMAHLLPKINAAIQRLKARGRIKAILEGMPSF
jgi:hypothetical protein